MKIIEEFKAFAVKGNAMDLAVGVIIGAAFGKIVNSIVQDMINPILGMLIGGVDLSHFQVVLKKPWWPIPRPISPRRLKWLLKLAPS